MKSDLAYVEHILECIRRIEENTAGGKEAFMKSNTLQDAVLRNLQTMSESSQRLSDAAKSRCPDVDWSRIAAFRNVLVHNYLGVDLDRTWDVVQRDVPGLKAAVQKMAR